MATPTSNYNYDPNAKFDNGQAAAGCGVTPNEVLTSAAIPQGLTAAGVLGNATLRVGPNAVGSPKGGANLGPNAAGQPKAINASYVFTAPGSSVFLDGGGSKAFKATV